MRHFLKFFSLRDFFKALKAKKTIEWGMNERFRYAELYVFFSYVGFYMYTIKI